MLRWQALYFSITKKMMENSVIYLETASIWHNIYIISVKAFFFFYMVIRWPTEHVKQLTINNQYKIRYAKK